MDMALIATASIDVICIDDGDMMTTLCKDEIHPNMHSTLSQMTSNLHAKHDQFAPTGIIS